MKVNNRLKYARDKRGWSQRELGEKAGVHSRTIQELEYGRGYPLLHNARKIADALERTVDFLWPKD